MFSIQCLSVQVIRGQALRPTFRREGGARHLSRLAVARRTGSAGFPAGSSPSRLDAASAASGLVQVRRAICGAGARKPPVRWAATGSAACSPSAPDAANATSSRAGGGPAGKPAVPVRQRLESVRQRTRTRSPRSQPEPWLAEPIVWFAELFGQAVVQPWQQDVSSAVDPAVPGPTRQRTRRTLSWPYGPANFAGSPIDAPCRESDKPVRSGSTVSENKGATGCRRIQVAPNLT